MEVQIKASEAMKPGDLVTPEEWLKEPLLYSRRFVMAGDESRAISGRLRVGEVGIVVGTNKRSWSVMVITPRGELGWTGQRTLAYVARTK